jgi:ABC-2 type transport system ATP-binding protein
MTVRYGKFEALKNFSVDIPEGAVGLLGPNGAGKTTLIKTLLGFVTPAAGSASILGMSMVDDDARIRQLVGYMPEQDCHIPRMSAVQYVAYAGELSGLPARQALRRAHEVLEYTGLGEARYREVDTYSTGMKQRIKFAQALVHGPKLLLLDEPTNGLDPHGREEMLKMVREVANEKGISVLVCSHLLRDIERTCDYVVVLTNGQLRAEGTIRDLKSIEGQPMDIELREATPGFAELISESGLQIERHSGAKMRVRGSGTLDETARAVFESAEKIGAQVRQLGEAERSLEEAFLEAIDNE